MSDDTVEMGERGEDGEEIFVKRVEDEETKNGLVKFIWKFFAEFAKFGCLGIFVFGLILIDLMFNVWNWF
jgi:hypothetical protein